jgi:GNAT superfamily N-acetyltransferase
VTGSEPKTAGPWVEPLRYSQARFLDPKHPFYDGGRAAEAEFFLARDAEGRTVGRVAAIENHLHNQHLQTRQPGAPREGFFGFFDCVDDPGVAGALLGAAEDWLRARGCRVMLGPASPSHNYELGLLIDGFDVPHRFMLVHNPATYQGLLEGSGLHKARDLYAFTYDLLDESEWELRERTASRFEEIWRKRYGSIHIRSLDMRRWNQEIRLAVELVNRSLEQNWGYSPITEGELQELAESLRFVVDPELVLFAEHDHRPIGVVLSLPDLNEAIAKLRLRWSYLELVELLVRARLHRFGCARTIALGVARDYPLTGVGPLLFLEVFRRYQRRGIRYLDASWILEDNEALLRTAYRFHGVPDRTYRVYHKDLV